MQLVRTSRMHSLAQMLMVHLEVSFVRGQQSRTNALWTIVLLCANALFRHLFRRH